ncbi:TonB-dependent receptor [Massilia endophytica]|uniref:TonB-dependent receptor n=1 Tax=Massilia endophytica TaxID=2899220 RepID=UPI001E62F595|nr:TonB-dependent receptor [Massilia endophytica]UGQ44549.1 TonB-dependent receptor [Massilia endophytica]
MAAAQFAMMASGAALAQSATDDSSATVVVTGQRAALQSAQNIKKNNDEIVDSIVADDIGKLPDRSVTEVLQRIPGVTIDRTMNRGDPSQGVGDGINHFASEGTGVSIRGLTFVRSELNGRDSFSANGGRALSFEDVPPELMAGLDVYKNPSAEQIEGAISGLVNLRTALPFDYKGFKAAISAEAAYSELRKKTSPAYSGIISNRWDTSFGQIGALLDLSRSVVNTRGDGVSISPYYPITNVIAGETDGVMRWVTPGASWSRNDFKRTREGMYGALQWKKGDFASALTFFKSKYEMDTTEFSFFQTTDVASMKLDPGATFDSKGVMTGGVVRQPARQSDGLSGIGFGTDARAAGRYAETRELAWNGSWRASPSWLFKADLQRVRATTTGQDMTVGIAGYVTKQTVNLGTSPATFSFDAPDRAAMTDRSKMWWDFLQQHQDHTLATQNAARIDAKYTFDHPVLQDLRFGLRATERDSLSQSTVTPWQNVSQTWSVGDSWQPLASHAFLGDPRFGTIPTVVQSFGGFWDNKVATPPSIIVPALSSVQGDPLGTMQILRGYNKALCKDKNPASDCTTNPPVYGEKEGENEQHERTQAAFAQLRFSFDNQLRYPVDGNVGLRFVRTTMAAGGYLLFSPPDVTAGVPIIPKYAARQTFENSYTNLLPSLNLRMKPSDELQFRFAVSRGMTRPDFYKLQAFTTLEQKVKTHVDQTTNQTIVDSVEYTGTAKGNTFLKPVMSNNIDLTAEWYFGRTSSLTLAVFNKRLSDIVIGKTTYYTLKDAAGAPHDFFITAPVNGAKGRASGIELGYQQYFDKLPGMLSGLGLSGNYTFIDSVAHLGAPGGSNYCTPKGTLTANLNRDLAGCDSDGRLFGNLPLEGMSKNAFNLAVLYDKGPWSGRIAYSWRSKYLQATSAYGSTGWQGVDKNPDSPNYNQPNSVDFALPTWGDSYGQVDMGVQYKFNDHLAANFEVSNLTNAIYRQLTQQHIGMKERSASHIGRRFVMQMRYSF